MISSGCKNCYAERMAKRLQAMGQPNYTNGFEVTLHEHVLEYPLQIKKSQVIFVNSMSDLFHEKVPVSFILKVFEVMKRASWHQFQVLTKRSDRLKEIAPKLECSKNIWMGVSVEDKDNQYRIDDLRDVPAAVRFLSLEPLIGKLPNLNLTNIDWVIAGGESGPGARPMKEEWIVQIKEQCLQQDVPFFFKQWGGTNKKKAGRQLQGRVWNEIPG